MSTGNIVTTQDSATNYTNEMSKMFGLSHQGVAGASNLGFDTVNNTHQDSQNSATSSILDNGVFGVGSASGSGNAGSSGAGSNGNVFTTNDHAVNFDSQMIKSFDFSHQGVAGSSNLAFAPRTSHTRTASRAQPWPTSATACSALAAAAGPVAQEPVLAPTATCSPPTITR